MIDVEFYGVLREVTDRQAVQLPLSQPAPLAQVLEELGAVYPGLAARLPRLACAVDDEIVPRETIIAPGSTLALLPPVSGG